MIKLQCAVLTAALLGRADAAGCYPGYTIAGGYAEGDQVSAAVQETESVEVDCSPAGEGGCGSNGKKNEDRTVTNHYNFACHTPVWCNNGDRDPAGIYSGTAWTKGEKCDTSDPAATNAPPEAWTGGGCPKAYVSGGDYESGDAVSVAKGAYTLVYRCVDGDGSAWCGNDGYKPGEGLYWTTSWEELGSCAGTISPTQSPSWDSLESAGGCPAEHEEGGDYDEGDRVAVNGFVFTCKGWPDGGHCGQPGYTPLADSATPDAWKTAWTISGYCSGTISPTSSPSYVALDNMGGCPDKWAAGSGADGYEEGDKVSNNGLVFACKGWPMGAHCGQAGYEPGVKSDTATDFWKDAWTVAGYCNGSTGPTASPSFDPDGGVGACPDEWESGGSYEEGDRISVTISDAPRRQVAFECKAWPFSGHCGQFAPLALGGDLGWTFAGSCNGSMGPTASPTFDALDAVEGCPAEYSASNTDYEAGDQVSAVISTEPKRALVYECRAWPNTDYCNQAGFSPSVSKYDYMGWELKGACSGSLAPTVSPTVYKGTCEYQKCNHGTYQDDCTEGTWGCINGKKSVSRCEYSTEDAEGWSDGATYETGDVVRLGLDRFKCREHPNVGWCGNAAYKPTSSSSGLWTQAWTRDGVCLPPQPTGSPTTASPSTPPTASPSVSPTTASPTGSPTKAPTQGPTGSPTKAPTQAPTGSPTQAPTKSPTP